MLPISSDKVERVECAPLPGEDVFGGLAPDEGLRLGVVLQQVIVDCVLEGRVANVVEIGEQRAPSM